MSAEGGAGPTFDAAPSEADADFVRKALDEFNLDFAPPYEHRKLEIVAKEGGRIVAGLLGGTYWSWLYVDRLWVDEDYRGKRLGSELLARAEAEAVARGCVGAYLDTMSFQAKGFYEKAGYREVGRIDDLPPGRSKHLLAKRLVART